MKIQRILAVLFVAVLALVLVRCSSAPKSGADQTTASNQPAPFSSSSNSSTTATTEEPKDGKKGFFSRADSALVPTSTTIPAGTQLSVRLQSTVSSANSNTGDSFDAVLDEPLVVSGKEIAPRGAAVTGRVVEAKSSGHLHDSGYIRLALATVTINGKAVPVQTSSVFAKGGNHDKRNLALIGGGTGAGALIGGLAGGGKGALIGSMVGAGAGTGGAYATGKKDVGFSSERRLTFRLTQPITVKG